MFNWFRKKKKETPQNAVIPAEDRGLTVSCTALSADLKIDDKQLIPIKDQRIIGRVVSLSPEVGKLISTTKTAKDAAQSVKSVGDIYRAVLSHGEQLFDSKTMKGAKRGGYLDANNQMHQANLVRVNGEVEGAMQSVANNQMVTSAFKQIKSQCKKKVQFPNEASLERFICGIVLEYNRESEERIHKGFALAQAQLTDLFI